VDDVDWNSNPSTTFSTKDGDISFAEYYKKVRIEYMKFSSFKGCIFIIFLPKGFFSLNKKSFT
jgi:hypothetical protein